MTSNGVAIRRLGCLVTDAVDPKVQEVCDAVIAAGAATSVTPELEAYAGQVVRLRDAQRRLAVEGAVVEDSKGIPIPHPALRIERDAQEELRKWGDRFHGLVF